MFYKLIEKIVYKNYAQKYDSLSLYIACIFEFLILLNNQ